MAFRDLLSRLRPAGLTRLRDQRAAIDHAEIGASGAIAGLLAAYVMFRPCKKITTLLFWFIVRIDAYWVIGAWVLFQLGAIALADDDGVAYAAHIGGLVAGSVLFALMRPAGIELFQCLDEPKVRADGTVT